MKFSHGKLDEIVLHVASGNRVTGWLNPLIQVREPDAMVQALSVRMAALPKNVQVKTPPGSWYVPMHWVAISAWGAISKRERANLRSLMGSPVYSVELKFSYKESVIIHSSSRYSLMTVGNPRGELPGSTTPDECVCHIAAHGLVSRIYGQPIYDEPAVLKYR
jgi:hypothetical protein